MEIVYAIRLLTRSHLKNRILVQDQGGAEFQPADILQYFEELKRGPNAEVGPKDIFEIASYNFRCYLQRNIYQNLSMLVLVKIWAMGTVRNEKAV